MKTLLAIIVLTTLLVYLTGTFVDLARYELQSTMSRIEQNTGGF